MDWLYFLFFLRGNDLRLDGFAIERDICHGDFAKGAFWLREDDACRFFCTFINCDGDVFDGQASECPKRTGEELLDTFETAVESIGLEHAVVGDG